MSADASEPVPQDADGGEARLVARPHFIARVGLKVAWIVLAVLLIGAPLLVRVGWEGRAELQAAAHARSQEDTDAEIEHLGRAARWRMIGLSHDEDALMRLEAIGRLASAAGEDRRHVALAAYREIRRALLATRSFDVPHADQFHRANAHIAALMAEQERAFGTDPAAREDPEAFHLALLERMPGPQPWRSNLAALAFLGWLVACGGFVLRGLDGQGRLRPRPALRWGGASLVLLVAWAVLLVVAR
ncbi:MAG: hypothetical protein JKY37_09635 [Nannocystaceae bacterium]|nr:hypothetical protein [Nannocystaceae bacterium]